MATLLLGAVGTAIAGPVGGALGALAGRSLDGALFGGDKRNGPRLTELAVSTSSYGVPIPRQFGRVRVPGTVIWATDLQESTEPSGGKGRPDVTQYSYTVSLAVALSSRPIRDVGRIWADGNLLRGAAGDLKATGTMRVHRGLGDQQADPLIASAQGAACPAFRDCAYVVFEDLDLTGFGNRIPALSFEVFADEGPVTFAALAEGSGWLAGPDILQGLAGLTLDAPDQAAVLETIDALYPLTLDETGATVRVTLEDAYVTDPVDLPEATVERDADFGAQSGMASEREPSEAIAVAIRYYDSGREYQPGLQWPSAMGTGRTARPVEIPAVLSAQDAFRLANTASARARRRTDRMRYRMAAIDPSLRPGRSVRVPGHPGVWRVTTAEWLEDGTELVLERAGEHRASSDGGATGEPALARDRLPSPTIFLAFEAPAHEENQAGRRIYAAAASTGPNWSGAQILSRRGDSFVPIGATGRRQAVIGHLAEPLAPSPALLLERNAQLDVGLVNPDHILETTDMEGLARGANRLMIGGEVVQFLRADHTGAAQWRLAGLLRGRAGTEPAAMAGHATGTFIVLLDDSLIPLEANAVLAGDPPVLAAIGSADDSPVMAELTNPGNSITPLVPVHARIERRTDGLLQASWTRRARGALVWHSEIEVPLGEESETYRVGIGDVSRPDLEFRVSLSAFTLSTDINAAHAGKPLWVRQVGTAAQSDPLLLTIL
ncbi:phage tail protein [Qipengyuania sp. JC766]|uniref:GTA baseplate fiber-binding domain-containing protein n=1 Tax=Qipengyuania sp. JC766 TaxID=3232139 RepID=UPI00345AB62E